MEVFVSWPPLIIAHVAMSESRVMEDVYILPLYWAMATATSLSMFTLVLMVLYLVPDMKMDHPHLPISRTNRIDIHRWGFQPRFVREHHNEGKDDLPKHSINNSGTPVHVRALEYLIEEPDLCNRHPDIRIISYVHSAVYKWQNRQLIRDTWGNLKYYPMTRMRVIFVFGAAADQDEQLIINRESSKYNDIVQTDFVDSYKNLSYKGVSALQWITEHCQQAQWILKSDDDMVINIFALVSYLKYYHDHEIKIGHGPPSKIMCAVWWGMPVLRGSGCAKWCVSMDEWPENSYPTYCSGSAFVIPVHLAPKLYDAYFHARFLWVDDAYISGVLPKAAGIKHHPIHSLYELNHHLIERNMVHGNRLFCHHPGHVDPRAAWWPLIVAKEVEKLQNSTLLTS